MYNINMNKSNETIKILMKEANLHPKIQQELLHCVQSGKSFPYVPKTLIKNKYEPCGPAFTSVLKLPSRPIQRPKSTIERLGDYERDKFRPNPSQTRPPYEKERLQNMMAYGKDIEEELRTIKFEDLPKDENSPVDMFLEILKEIKERKDFLDEMAALGEGKKYLPDIMCQISLRLRELEKIDKKRAQLYVQQYRM